jgi:hypothetical protein
VGGVLGGEQQAVGPGGHDQGAGDEDVAAEPGGQRDGEPGGDGGAEAEGGGGGPGFDRGVAEPGLQPQGQDHEQALQLDLLARRSNVHQSPPDLGDLIEHLLIGQIKHLVRLLGGIERLVGLGLHYRVGPLEKAHAGLLLAKDGPAAPIPPPGRLRIDVGADTGTDTPEATAEAAR